MNRLKFIFPKEILLQLYHALIHSHILYALPVWSLTYKTYLNKVAALQNKAAKIITGANWNDKSLSSYNSLKMLKLNELYKLETAKIMHYIYTHEQPYNLSQYFSKSGCNHTYSTRNSTLANFSIPLYRTTKVQQSYHYQGSKIWNSIPHDIKISPF